MVQIKVKCVVSRIGVVSSAGLQSDSERMAKAGQGEKLRAERARSAEISRKQGREGGISTWESTQLLGSSAVLNATPLLFVHEIDVSGKPVCALYDAFVQGSTLALAKIPPKAEVAFLHSTVGGCSTIPATLTSVISRSR
ncbi:hypothetical protein P692DRAFT_201805802 [Suillus brevipes Sb2]|nr:hypothetical protein P692DRAFT_201805802 [Suillus brevipes Sb2]